MLDTTFGNVKADLTYEEMIELVSGVKPGDMIKLRDDLEEWGIEYRVKSIKGTFGDRYAKQDSLYYGILENNCDDCSLKCKWGEVECQYDWIPYNMVDIDWLVAQRAKEEKVENLFNPQKIDESVTTYYPLKERIKEEEAKTEDNLKTLEKLTEAMLSTETTYCAAPVNQQFDFFTMAEELNSMVELEIVEAVEKLKYALMKAKAVNRSVNIKLPNSARYFGVKGTHTEVEQDTKEITIVIK